MRRTLLLLILLLLMLSSCIMRPSPQSSYEKEGVGHDTFQRISDRSSSQGFDRTEDGEYVFTQYEIRSGKIYHSIDRIEEADPATFDVIGYNGAARYGKDKNHVWRGSLLIKGADPASFQVLPLNYAKDKDHVWRGHLQLRGADPASFEILSSSYTKDSSHVYCGWLKVVEADPATFEVVGDRYYGKDKTSVYYCSGSISGKIVEADPTTFQNVRQIFSKDVDNVFRMERTLEGVDPATFEYLGGAGHFHLYRDAERVFTFLSFIRDAHPASFKILSEHAPDDHHSLPSNYEDENHSYHWICPSQSCNRWSCPPYTGVGCRLANENCPDDQDRNSAACNLLEPIWKPSYVRGPADTMLTVKADALPNTVRVGEPITLKLNAETDGILSHLQWAPSFRDADSSREVSVVVDGEPADLGGRYVTYYARCQNTTFCNHSVQIRFDEPGEYRIDAHSYLLTHTDDTRATHHGVDVSVAFITVNP